MASYGEDQKRSRYLVAVLTMAVVCLVSLPGTTGRADEQSPTRQDRPLPAAPQEQPAAFVGTADCLRCHRRHDGPHDELDYSSDVREFAGLDQSTIWQTSDKHRLAVSNLFGERGLRMIERLGLVPDDIDSRGLDDPSYRRILQKNLLESRECLSCHANWRHGDPPPEERVALYGVHCEACHGAASKWFLPHSKPQWRRVSPREKFERFGMVDVRNPVTRARQCLSCHVGNAAEGKVLTHDMYAAGHPPLPGIEIESYQEQMPRHWRDLSEKGNFEHRDDFMRLNGYRARDLSRSRSLVLSGIVALQHSVEFLADRYAIDQDAPDFAAFNCADCHHDLRVNSWRQEGLPPGIRPGRPRPAIWPEVLADVGLAQACSTAKEFSERRAELQSLLETLNRAVSSRPFGDPAAVRRQARELRVFLDEVLMNAAARPFDEGAARRSLELLTCPDDGIRIDYDAARQIGWGARIVALELASRCQSVSDARTRGFEKSADAAPDRRVMDLFSGKTTLDAMLRLKLPAGPSASVHRNLPRQMQAAYAYDPRKFREELQILHRELQRKLPR